jgi:hypothetical protein
MRLLFATRRRFARRPGGSRQCAGPNSQWCADYGRDSATNCGFRTYEQCRATIAGFNQGTCYRNPQFMGDQHRNR